MSEKSRRRNEVDPIFVNGRVGLAVMEIQVLHYGHIALLSWLRAACGRRILALGSCDAGGEPGHPFTFAQRKAMVEAVFGPDAFTFVALNDIDSADPEDWLDYVDARLKANSLPRPTDYFAGSRHDARWYEGAFARIDGPGEAVGPGRAWYDKASGRAVHILDREAGDLPSARNIRDLIAARDPEWQRFVPPILWAYVERNYPPVHRAPLRGAAPPEAALHPVGTRFRADGAESEVLALRDDGKWRPLRTRPDEKNEHAARRAAERG